MTVSLETRIIEGEPRLVGIANPDFPDLKSKKIGVFALEEYTAGGSTPEDLNPHPFEAVEKVLLRDTNPQEVIEFLGRASIPVL